MSGAPTLSAMSISLWTFSANTSPSAPPKIVKSWLNTNTLRPSTVPHPVMTPSVYGRSMASGNLRASEEVELVERAGVEEVLDPLAGEHLAPVVLPLSRRLRAGVERLFLALVELLEPLAQRMFGHGGFHGSGATRDCPNGVFVVWMTMKLPLRPPGQADAVEVRELVRRPAGRC